MKKNCFTALMVMGILYCFFANMYNNTVELNDISFMRYDRIIEAKGGGCLDCVGTDCCTPCTEAGYYFTYGPTLARVGSIPLCDYYYDCTYYNGDCILCDIISPAYIGVGCY